MVRKRPFRSVAHPTCVRTWPTTRTAPGAWRSHCPRGCRHSRSPTDDASTGSGRPEDHGNAVHAVAKARGLWPVVEHVAEVPAAASAEHLGARHEQTVVGSLDHRIVERLPEARPPGAAVELGVGGEQVERTPGTAEDAAPVFIVEWTAVRRLGAGLSQNVVLSGSQQPLPLVVGMRDLVAERAHAPAAAMPTTAAPALARNRRLVASIAPIQVIRLILERKPSLNRALSRCG